MAYGKSLYGKKRGKAKKSMTKRTKRMMTRRRR